MTALTAFFLFNISISLYYEDIRKITSEEINFYKHIF